MGLLAAIMTVMSVLAVGLRWIYKQGAAGEELKNSVDQNTRATDALNQSYKIFTTKIQDTILDHEKRLTRLETTTEIQRSKGQ